MKVTYIISGIDKALHFEWVATHLTPRFDVQFILIGKPNSLLEQFLIEKGISVRPIHFSDKKWELPKVAFKLFSILLRNRPKVIHTHLFLASAMGLLVGKVLGIKKRVYTRHHGSIHHNYFPKTVKYDRVINRLATHIIVLSQNHYRLLEEKEGAPRNKLHLIYHGFDLELFHNVNKGSKANLMNKYGFPERAKLIGSISRFTYWKGVQFTIAAFKTLSQRDGQFHLILANAQGDYEAEINKLLEDLPPTSYSLIPFEENVASLYHIFDYFVHVPIDPFAESFGQTYIEALASGVPSIFTLSGVAADFVKSGEDAQVVPFESSEAIVQSILFLEANPVLKEKQIEVGKETVHRLFGLEKMIQKLSNLYTEH